MMSSPFNANKKKKEFLTTCTKSFSKDCKFIHIENNRKYEQHKVEKDILDSSTVIFAGQNRHKKVIVNTFSKDDREKNDQKFPVVELKDGIPRSCDFLESVGVFLFIECHNKEFPAKIITNDMNTKYDFYLKFDKDTPSTFSANIHEKLNQLRLERTINNENKKNLLVKDFDLMGDERDPVSQLIQTNNNIYNTPQNVNKTDLFNSSTLRNNKSQTFDTEKMGVFHKKFKAERALEKQKMNLFRKLQKPNIYEYDFKFTGNFIRKINCPDRRNPVKYKDHSKK